MYTISWSPNSTKFLRKLPKELSKRIVLKVNSIKKNPFIYLEHYEGDNFYKLRVGDYRLLVDIDLSKKILKIQVIGHRNKIYKKS